MYPRCSPGWVVSNHPKDQLANFPRRRSSSEREILQNKISATAEKTNQGSNPEEKQA